LRTENLLGAFLFLVFEFVNFIKKEFAAKEKLEIVSFAASPASPGRAETRSDRRIFAAAGGKKCSNYFQNRAHFVNWSKANPLYEKTPL